MPQLKLKWSFGFPAAEEVYGQLPPSPAAVFIGVDTGAVHYSIDAATGCVYWSFQAEGGVRNAISIAPAKSGPAKYAAYFGDITANLYKLGDASTGKLVCGK